MILHDFALSSASFRVRIVLNLKGIAYDKRNYVLREGEQRAPDYLALNPAGLVPALEVDGMVLGQSLAIIDYLDATHPEPKMCPADPLARARVLEMALTIAADIHPLQHLRVLNYLRQDLGQPEPAVLAWLHRWLGDGLAALEAQAPEAGLFGGESPNLADVCLVPQMYSARRFGQPLEGLPRLVRIDATLRALDPFARAAPEAVKPA